MLDSLGVKLVKLLCIECTRKELVDFVMVLGECGALFSEYVNFFQKTTDIQLDSGFCLGPQLPSVARIMGPLGSIAMPSSAQLVAFVASQSLGHRNCVARPKKIIHGSCFVTSVGSYMYALLDVIPLSTISINQLLSPSTVVQLENRSLQDSSSWLP